MDRQQLSAVVGEMKHVAMLFVRRYAAMHAPDVPTGDVDSICAALGDISIDEATTALDRFQTGMTARVGEIQR